MDPTKDLCMDPMLGPCMDLMYQQFTDEDNQQNNHKVIILYRSVFCSDFCKPDTTPIMYLILYSNSGQNNV